MKTFKKYDGSGALNAVPSILKDFLLESVMTNAVQSEICLKKFTYFEYEELKNLANNLSELSLERKRTLSPFTVAAIFENEPLSKMEWLLEICLMDELMTVSEGETSSSLVLYNAVFSSAHRAQSKNKE